jgi:hypothetical protein
MNLVKFDILLEKPNVDVSPLLNWQKLAIKRKINSIQPFFINIVFA